MPRFERYKLEIAETNGTAGAPQRCDNLGCLCLQLGGNMLTASIRIQGTSNGVDWANLQIDDVIQPITDETITCSLALDGHPYLLKAIRLYTVTFGVSAAPTGTLVGRNVETFPR